MTTGVVNTLLKVLEQLLHKIKANRRREIGNHYERGKNHTFVMWANSQINKLYDLVQYANNHAVVLERELEANNRDG